MRFSTRTNSPRRNKTTFDVLSDLVAAYEEEAVPIKPVSDADMLRFLIEAKGVTQVQAAKEAGIAESTISEVLAGRRKLNRASDLASSHVISTSKQVRLRS